MKHLGNIDCFNKVLFIKLVSMLHSLSAHQKLYKRDDSSIPIMWFSFMKIDRKPTLFT